MNQSAATKTWEKITFKIHGEDLTRLTRSLWADELQTVKAIRILVTGLINFTETMALEVLTGKKKLVGCNTLHLEDDNAKMTPCGCELSFESVMSRIDRKQAENEWDALIMRQRILGSVHYSGSPWGHGSMPDCVWEKLQSGAWGWAQVRRYFMQDDFKYQHGTDAYGDETKEADDEEEAIRNSSTESLLDKFVAGDRAIAEMQEEGAKPDKGLISENGWVAPNGDFFPCGPVLHDALADILGGGTKNIEQTHVRISKNDMSGWRPSIQFVGKELTQSQKTTIWDWCEKHSEKCPEWVFKDQDN